MTELLKRIKVKVADRGKIVTCYVPEKDGALEERRLGPLNKDMRLLWAIAMHFGEPDFMIGGSNYEDADLIAGNKVREFAQKEIETLCLTAFWELVGLRFGEKIDHKTHTLALRSDWAIWAIFRENLSPMRRRGNVILDRIDTIIALLNATVPPRRD